MGWKLDKSHKPNHNSYALYYHVVFVTQRREPTIDQEIAAFLMQFFQDKCDEMSIHLLEANVLCDHVHLILSLRPTHYIPEVLNILKGTSAHEANHHHNFQQTLHWMRGYHVETISPRLLMQVKDYVRRQYQHHPDKIPLPPGQDQGAPP